MGKEKKEKILHDLKRIAEVVNKLSEAVDGLIEDLDEVGRELN